EILLYDRTGGREQLILPPGEERIRKRSFNYRRREFTTAVLVDNDDRTKQDLQFARTLRAQLAASELVQVIPEGFLPPTVEVFEGLDLIVVAGQRLANDPTCQLMLRRWLELGGWLWVLLDRVIPEVASLLAGDGWSFQIVDRVSAMSMR